MPWMRKEASRASPAVYLQEHPLKVDFVIIQCCVTGFLEKAQKLSTLFRLRWSPIIPGKNGGHVMTHLFVTDIFRLTHDRLERRVPSPSLSLSYVRPCSDLFLQIEGRNTSTMRSCKSRGDTSQITWHDGASSLSDRT